MNEKSEEVEKMNENEKPPNLRRNMSPQYMYMQNITAQKVLQKLESSTVYNGKVVAEKVVELKEKKKDLESRR